MANVKRKPGTLCTLGVKGQGYHFTKKQKAMFCELYPKMHNKEISAMFGLSVQRACRYARKFGVKKDRKMQYERLSANAKKRFEDVRRKKKWGIDIDTMFHFPSEKYTTGQLRLRSIMGKRGYIPGDPREKFGERYTIYYDSETDRKASLELLAGRHNLTIKELRE